jgi:hypothetical protein
MNLERPPIPSAPPQSQISDSDNSSIQPGARVEPCEFEDLLRRAMEILDTRARAATNGSNT